MANNSFNDFALESRCKFPTINGKQYEQLRYLSNSVQELLNQTNKQELSNTVGKNINPTSTLR